MTEQPPRSQRRGGAPLAVGAGLIVVLTVLVGVLVVAGNSDQQAATRTYTAPGGPTYAVGTVKFFSAEEGWGGITSPAVDADVWVHFSAIDIKGGLRALAAGEPVEFRYHPERHDSWRYVASWVRPLPQLAVRRQLGAPPPPLIRPGRQFLTVRVEASDTSRGPV